MTIHLPKDIERDILAEVHSGHFASVDDALVQAWQTLRRQVPASTKPKAAPATGKKATHPKAANPKKPLTPAEFDQYLLEIGLMSQLPDTDADFDDPADEPITIQGEPLSETVIRERR